MPFKRLTYGDTSLTAGTPVSGDTSGFIMPFDGFVGHIWKSTGSDSESYKFRFPGGQHAFNEENVFMCGGEIAINTKIQNHPLRFPEGASWCGWALPKGTRITYEPDGAESSDDAVLQMEVFTPDSRPNFFPYNQGPLHHIRMDDITYGTTTDGTKICDLPAKVNGIAWMAAHGAGQNTWEYRLEKDGYKFAIPGNHNAIDAAEEPVGWYWVGHTPDEIVSRRVYYSNNAFYFTGTAVAASYIACPY